MIRKRYLDTSHGQVHARVAGSGDALVLLHNTPGSGAQFEHVMPLFAARGYQAWALDLFGNGLSDPIPDPWSFEQSATTIGEALDDAGIRKAAIAGGHMAGQVAVELASQRPALVHHLIIDGIPLWDRAIREGISAHFDLSRPVPAEDGGHLHTHWQRSLGIQRAWNPAVEPGSVRVRNALINELLFGISESAQRAFLNYEVAPRLSELVMPVLVTSATDDTLHDQFDAALASIPGARGFIFEGAHPVHCDDRGQEYADIVVAFLQGKNTGKFLLPDA